MLYRATDLSAGELVRILGRGFTSYGVAKEFNSYRAKVFTGHVFKEVCKVWGVRHRVSSADHPKSNLWPKVGVKTIHRFAADCTEPGGSVDMSPMVAPMLQYRNTPCRFFGVTPTQKLFARKLQDGLCVALEQFKLRADWDLTAE